ncbi:MAG TPA: diaminopimelate decarboxylase [Phycisphaerae bacterium]|nr:diaminopimelate decarboxylase [Phycisphaerae bacterium]
MDHFHYINGQLFAENVPVSKIARDVGTPTYIYSKATLLTHYRRIADAFAALKPTICYSVKSLPNVNLLKLLVAEGSGMDVTSGGELFRALKAGCSPDKIFFAGVGKTDHEIREALAHNIRAFNVESEEEFWNLDRIAGELGKTAHAALRVNPGLQNRSTHTKTFTARKEDKFGINIDRAANFYRQASKERGGAKNVRLHGLHLHLGSPIKFTEPYAEGITKALALIDELAKDGIKIETLDTGGGFAAFYEGNEAPAFVEYAATIVPLLQERVQNGLQIIMEPGRSIACNAGILLAQVQYTKAAGEKKYVIIDAAMNDLIRPTLYESYHFIWPANPGPAMVPPNRTSALRVGGDEKVDIVGPICESGDYLAKNRYIAPATRGDLLAIFSAGAYGMSMSSNYNSRPRAAEVLVDNDSFTLIRQRESYEDLLHNE